MKILITGGTGSFGQALAESQTLIVGPAAPQPGIELQHAGGQG